MRKALYIYGSFSGHGIAKKKEAYILKRLKGIFDQVDVCCFSSLQEAREKAKESCGVYDSLLIGGGDGTFNQIIDSIAKFDNKPVIGFIGLGTLCDVGANFGYKRNIRKALRIIKEGNHKRIDLGLINGHYFVYMAAAGAFSDISLIKKKRLKRFSYYLKAIKEALRPRKYFFEVKTGSSNYKKKAPFLLIMNGSHVGGFKVNKGKIDDGLLDVYLAPVSLFNGLINYLLFKIRILHIKVKNADICIDKPLKWCLDGEEGPIGDIHLEVVPSALDVYCSKRKLK